MPERYASLGVPEVIARALLAILLLTAVGTLAELLLLEHYDDWQQWIPLVLLAVSAAVIGWQAIRPSRGSQRALRVVMASVVFAGIAGVVLHLQGNLEFEQELNPGASGMALWFEVARGATPALAPGSLVPFGLLGLLYGSRRAKIIRQDD